MRTATYREDRTEPHGAPTGEARTVAGGYDYGNGVHPSGPCKGDRRQGLRTEAATPETHREGGPCAPGDSVLRTARDPVPWYLRETPYRGGSE